MEHAGARLDHERVASPQPPFEPRVEMFGAETVGGSATLGTRMFVFPDAKPKLHIVEAAGQAIQPGAPSGVTVELPAGSPTVQTVRLRGEGFTGIVPVRIVVTPEHSPSSVFDLDLNGSGNPAEVSTQITLPIGEPTRIDAWTR